MILSLKGHSKTDKRRRTRRMVKGVELPIREEKHNGLGLLRENI